MYRSLVGDNAIFQSAERGARESVPADSLARDQQNDEHPPIHFVATLPFVFEPTLLDIVAAHVLSGTVERLRNLLQDHQRLLDHNASLQAMLVECTRDMEHARHAACHDEMTGALNRQLLPKLLGDAIAFAQQSHKCVAVVLLDFDGFKHVNDRFGHASGDLVLQTMVARIATYVGASGMLFRYGGDEFVVILEDMDRLDAMCVVDAIADAIAAPCPLGWYALSLTASAGVAMYPEDGKNAAQLLRSANKAMYRQKPRLGLGYRSHFRLRYTISAQDSGNGDLKQATALPQGSDRQTEV